MNRVRLLVFNPVLSVLDYRVPAGMEVEPGSVVIAPLGPRQVLGIVWEPERLPGDEVPEAKLRPMLEVLPVPPLAAAAAQPDRMDRRLLLRADERGGADGAGLDGGAARRRHRPPNTA